MKRKNLPNRCKPQAKLGTLLSIPLHLAFISPGEYSRSVSGRRDLKIRRARRVSSSDCSSSFNQSGLWSGTE